MKTMRHSFLIAVMMAVFPSLALAADGIAVPWQLGFQEAATPVMQDLTSLNHYLEIVISVIAVFVLLLLLVVCLRFNERSNPVPSKVTHNTMLEILWTTVPILILVSIAIPSLKLHYKMDRTEHADMTLKVTGRQWYWEYEYPDQNGLAFESRIKPQEELQKGEPRLLTVDNPIYVPLNKVVRLLVTGGDVIHAWAMPAFGVKIDAVPGRLNETWFKAERTGTFYGQCSELCGVDHGFMPIVVKVVSEEEFAAWVAEKQKSADAGAGPVRLSAVR